MAEVARSVRESAARRDDPEVPSDLVSVRRLNMEVDFGRGGRGRGGGGGGPCTFQVGPRHLFSVS